MIRLANGGDAIAIHHLLDQLGYFSELNTIKDLLSNNHAEDDAEFRSAIYVYKKGEETAGLISLIRFDYFPTGQTYMRVTALCVDEQHRGVGLGEKLLSFAENLATGCGDAAIEVTCSLKRERTHRFYLKNGYTQHSYKFIRQLPIEDSVGRVDS
jgi:GNAT superfamily N-acetyltransferase